MADGCYKLSWRERICFCSGDVAQNIIYQTMSIWLLCIAQVIKSSGILVANGYMWALVPEVVTFGEYLTGKRVAAIVNAIMCLFLKAGMALGGVIPGFVLAWVGFNASAPEQSDLALQGILWLVTIIPAILMVIGIFVINRYELSDARMDEINSAL